jgi:crossover junction endodeoxyribonuclease RusA
MIDMIIKLDYPHSDLMPNRKNGNHWAKTAKVKDSARDSAYYATLEALQTQKLIHGGLIPLTITFVQSDKRHRDLDNLLASAKSALDGMAKALKVDDSIFEPITIRRGFNIESCMLINLQFNDYRNI